MLMLISVVNTNGVQMDSGVLGGGEIKQTHASDLSVVSQPFCLPEGHVPCFCS